MIGLSLASCDKDKPIHTDSAAVVAAPVLPATPAAPNTGWDEPTAGPVMLIAIADNSAGASVVLPLLTDSSLNALPRLAVDSLSNSPVELFSRAGLAGSTAVIVERNQQIAESCAAWPRARLAEVPEKTWRIGFMRGIAVPLPLDSLEGMTPQDSTMITRELARLSSMVAEGDDPAFRGLPFSVRKAYRFAISGRSVLIGDVVRKLNEEANPRQEHLLLIAEKPTDGAEYSVVFQSRVAGAEDAVRTNEILSALRFVKTKRPAVVVSFEYEDGGRIALIQRAGNAAWNLTWRSAYTGC